MSIRMTHPNLDGHIDVATERAAKVHERSGWRRANHPCPDCDRAFDTSRGLASHSRIHNDDDSDTETDPDSDQEE